MFNHRICRLALFFLSLAAAPAARAAAGTPTHAPDGIGGYPTSRVVAPASLVSALAALAAMHKKVPAYSRQTGLACSSCHYQFPQLNPFGRQFKLNGYTLSGLQPIVQPGDTINNSLRLSPIPGIAVMLVSSVTATKKAIPGTQNATASFPEQFSIFAAGALTPNIGMFSQFTYAAADGSFGIDNFDLRYANHRTVNDKPVIYGLTLHNNPTVQDVWNTVPAWSYPFMSSSTAPSPIASTLIDGGLAQQVVGLGAYTLFDNLLYGEFTAYRSAPQGKPMPLDSSAVNTTSGVIPYWRVALQHETENRSLMLGTFGFDAHLFPTGVTGPRNHYTDVALDAQVEQRNGAAAWIGRASLIHERQQLIATQLAGGSDNIDLSLSSLRASVAYLPSLRYAFTVGYFQTNGTSDATLFSSEAITGSRTGSPNTSGATAEFNYNAWQNTRIGVQYTAYTKFNGSSSAFDVANGRNATDNNTLYLYLWAAF